MPSVLFAEKPELVEQYRLVSLCDHAPIDETVYSTFDDAWEAAAERAERGAPVAILCFWKVSE